MSPYLVLLVLIGYFGILYIISRITSRKITLDSYFTGNRRSPWYAVAFGMIGASLSGITFISVPGEVGNTHFYYFQLVLGYLAGYLIIAMVLLPLYYRLKLVSIYTYLEQRFGIISHKAGAFYFLVAQSIGASLRLFVVATVLQVALFNYFRLPFMATVIITIGLIWVYTNKAGIKTIVWTDTFQTFTMLLSVTLTIFIIARSLHLSADGVLRTITESRYSRIFNWDWNYDKNFYKQFITGVVVAIAMNGLDQNEMQKSLTCRNLKDAQKNIYLYTVILVLTNLVFLSLGVLLYAYADATHVRMATDVNGHFMNTDMLFPDLAINHFTTAAGVIFLLGISAAAFSSADSALTALTTAFYTDFLRIDDKPDRVKRRIRQWVNIGFSLLLILIVFLFKVLNNDSVINTVYTVAGYTYGPLLGLFGFGLINKRKVRDRWVPVVILIAPVLAYLFNRALIEWVGFYVGYTLLLVNGIFTYMGLWLIRKPMVK